MDLTELSKSPWSAYSALIGYIERSWQDISYILSFFGEVPESRKRYQEFVAQGVSLDKRPELSGGGVGTESQRVR